MYSNVVLRMLSFRSYYYCNVIILATCILNLSPLNLYHISFMHYFRLIDHLAFNSDSLGCGGVGGSVLFSILFYVHGL